MTDLEIVLKRRDATALKQRLPRVAMPCLRWLRVRGLEDELGSTRPLESGELSLLCAAMLARFDGDPEFTWSSYMLDTCLSAVGEAANGPPEPFIRQLWEALDTRPLDQNVFNFCRAVSIALRGGGYAEDPRWDLEWLLRPSGDSQRCLQYWVVGMKQHLVDMLPDEDPFIQRLEPFFR